MLLHQLVSQGAVAHPERTALVVDDDVRTFAELEERTAVDRAALAQEIAAARAELETDTATRRAALETEIADRRAALQTELDGCYARWEALESGAV